MRARARIHGLLRVLVVTRVTVDEVEKEKEYEYWRANGRNYA